MPKAQPADISERADRKAPPAVQDPGAFTAEDLAAMAAAFAAADREVMLGSAEDLFPPESRSAVWEDAPGFPDGDSSDLSDPCEELLLWLSDFSDAEEGLSNWTVFHAPLRSGTDG